jgi:hypothetical protein
VILAITVKHTETSNMQYKHSLSDRCGDLSRRSCGLACSSAAVGGRGRKAIGLVKTECGLVRVDGRIVELDDLFRRRRTRVVNKVRAQKCSAATEANSRSATLRAQRDLLEEPGSFVSYTLLNEVNTYHSCAVGR